MGLNLFENTKKYQTKLAWALPLPLALFFYFFSLGACPPFPSEKNEKNKANGNGNAHANFDWYFLVLFFKIVQAHLAQAHLTFAESINPAERRITPPNVE